MSITFAATLTENPDGSWNDVGGPSLNVSNTNAALLLERLGVEFDHSGSIDADDLLGRALTANVGRDDNGMPAAEYHEPGKLRMTDCGLRPGYFEDRLAVLVTVANHAQSHGVSVTWG